MPLSESSKADGAGPANKNRSTQINVIDRGIDSHVALNRVPNELERRHSSVRKNLRVYIVSQFRGHLK